MGKSPFKWRCSIAILVYQRVSSKYADWILKDLDFLQTFKSILTKRGCARPVYSRSFEGVISRKYGEISWNIPIISPSKCLWQNLSEHATSHSFGPPACIVGTTQRLRRPPVMETLDGNTVKTMSPWAVKKKNATLGRCSSIDWPKESEAGKPSKYWGLPRCRQRCQNERT